MEVFGGELDELTIGTYTFVNSQTILTGLAGLQSVYSTELDGILGYNFLAEGRVVINYRKSNYQCIFISRKTMKQTHQYNQAGFTGQCVAHKQLLSLSNGHSRLMHWLQINVFFYSLF